MPHFSEHAADILFAAANWMLAGGSLVVLVGAILVAWVTPMREQYSAEKVEMARTAAAEANERAAQAHERAAQLEKESIQAKTDLARLQERTAWRTISDEAVARMLPLLPRGDIAIDVQYAGNDPEAFGLATQFAHLVDLAGWTALVSSRTYASALVYGLYVPGPETPTTRALREALTVGGFTFATETLPEPEMMMKEPGPPTSGLLYIGSKKPPI